MKNDKAEQARIEVRSYYVRERHAMALRADLKPLYVDVYLHLMQHDVELEPEHAELLKDGLAAMVLHLTSRPWDEITAWTLNFPRRSVNLFLTGDSRDGYVVGRVFTEDVREGEASLFYAQVSRPRAPLRQSTVEFQGDDVFSIVEQYYRQSEQLPARYFRLGDEQYTMVVAQPDCDMVWFDGLDEQAAQHLDRDQQLALLEQREFFFGCTCVMERFYAALAPAAHPIDALFQGAEQIVVNCPRCAARIPVERDKFAAYLEEKRGPAAPE
ncbi:MAG: disulfide bond chaperone [Planctomycetes bacterium]|nr:disulfide bond chaperone [Planctomycetota bacterium]